jgi:hypothetical protein
MSTSRLKVSAIVLGILTDFVFSGIIAIALLFVFGGSAHISASTTGDNQLNLGVPSTFYIASLVGGLLACIIAGYVTARMAKTSELLHAACVGVVGMLFGLISPIIGGSSYPIWFQVLSYLLVLPSCVLGGFLFLRTRQPQAETPGTAA